MHGCQAQDVAQGVLWKPRDLKEKKTEDNTLMSD